MSKHQDNWQNSRLKRIGVTSILLAAVVASSASAQTQGAPGHPLIVPPYPVRFGDRSLESTIRTDERYGHDGLFQGPRGWVYWNYLENPQPIQNPNLWPDMRSTYFLGRFSMPAGSSMTLRGEFPYARFFQFALYKWEHNTFVAMGESLRGPDIVPDSGSTNPFRVGADRLRSERRFTIHVIAKDPPQDSASRPENTLYVGTEGRDIQAVIRIYLPDQNKDGTGWGPPTIPYAKRGLPSYDAELADGSKLPAEDVVSQFAKPFTEATKQPMTTDQWEELVHAKDNDPSLTPATAPARNPPQWEKFWTIAYSVVGVFKSPEERAKTPYEGAMEGGGEGPYLVTYLSRHYGPVYVMQGKMPTFPNTYAGKDGQGAATMPAGQTQYWSLVSCEAVPSGQVVDGLTDFQVPLDEDRNYTIVVSRPEDRPSNATHENGVAWVKWSPRGEGLRDPRNRSDFGMLILRIMGNSPTWKQRPDNITKPGTGAEVMGPYFPKGHYTTKGQFETHRATKP
ncbi:hypothetical protein [Bythopirellula goksoeyrii]|uniref:Uncharacterized protein n=1 Tax=Bythopirellula goksoeyrii TaxID=1400387 RepID=A0A5B9QFV7_9BACT|nr:hypothetical protein [Bythopirellula goksoeyrii]QEG33221.1 hypothetical protein Pr1d_04820 [Bythopirellula goksoeyrii]